MYETTLMTVWSGTKMSNISIGCRVVHINRHGLSGKVDGFTSDGKVVVVWKDNSIGRCYPENLVIVSWSFVDRIFVKLKESLWGYSK